MHSSGPMSAARTRLAVLAAAALASSSLVALGALVAPGAAAVPAGASKTSTTTTKGAVPAAPTSVVAVPGDRSATISWTPPAGEVKRYKVTETVSGRSKPVPRGKDGVVPTSVKMYGLTNGVAARFVVRAENFSGQGPDSKPSSAVVPLPTLYADGTLLEGGSPTRNQVRVRLSQKLDHDLVFRIRTTDEGQAQPGKDFVALDATVTIPAGKSVVLVPLTVVDDTVSELTETVTFSITSSQARQADVGSTTTIVDDDAATYLYLDGATTVAEGDTGTTPLRFGLRLSRAVDDPVTVRLQATTTYLTQGGPLVTPARIQLVQPLQVVTIPAGAVSMPVVEEVLGDLTPEPATMHLTVDAEVLSGPALVAVGSNDGEVTDDDTSAPSGADLAVALPDVDLWDAQGDGRLAVEVTNDSGVAAKGVVVTVGASVAGAVDGLAATVSADSACTLVTRAAYVAGTDPSPGTLEWSCSLGALAAHGQRVLHFPVRRSGSSQPAIDWSVGVTSSPFADPDLTDNAAEGVVRFPSAG